MIPGGWEVVKNKAIEVLIINDNNQLVLSFLDGTKLTLWDAARGCCEHRYMSTSADLSYYKGSVLFNIEVKPGPDVKEKEWSDVKECEFLDITTDKGVFTIDNYNEHNGYYGGFDLQSKVE